MRSSSQPVSRTTWCPRSRPSHERRHNLLYWAQGNDRGIGSAAYSHHDGRRWWNVQTPDRYISLIESGSSVEAGAEVLSAGQGRFEVLELALRTTAGVPAIAFGERADHLRAAGLIAVGRPGAAHGCREAPGNEVATRLQDAGASGAST
jgi:coproporphyrinogen III oxidase-like Fe-S oxidoreductase